MICKVACSLVAAFGLSACPTLADDVSPAARFTQDRFAIGFWVDPPSDQQTDARFAEIAAANFTLVIGNFGATTPAQVTNQLALCEKHGLKAIVSMAGLPPDKLPTGNSCWGYHIVDEPSADSFPGLRNIVDSLRKARPGKLGYINLYPSYAPLHALGTTSYVQHVSRFVSEVRPDVLCMDHYPMFQPTGADGRDSYCQNLEVLRQESVSAKIPFWNFFNTMPFGPHSDPTEAQIRWQIFASIAHGAKGVLYFCYWTPGGGEFPKGGAILRRDGSRTRHYEEARRINARLKNIGPILMQLTSTGVHRVKSSKDISAPLAEAGLKTISDGNYLIGTFRHDDGRRAILIQNYEFAYSAWPTVEFDVDKVLEVSQDTGKQPAIKDDSPDMPGLQVSLDAGEGRLFLLPAGK
jgi:hypothetical protein